MAGAVDFIVKSPENSIQLLVEAKTSSDSSSQWAAQLRRNVMQYATASTHPYFILALPDHLYLWKNAGAAGTAPPDFDIETTSTFKHYAERLGTPLNELGKNSFELVVRTWLEELIMSVTTATGPTESWVASTGLSDRIRDGSITTQP
jgi:hypothetical protein